MKWEYVMMVEGYAPSPHIIESPVSRLDFMEKLNELGSQGWELISFMEERHTALLKRAK